jgi:predicted dehydrogenase
MALTIAEADRIVKAVEDNNTPFTMLWQMRCDPPKPMDEELHESGILGQVLPIQEKAQSGNGAQPRKRKPLALHPGTQSRHLG